MNLVKWASFAVVFMVSGAVFMFFISDSPASKIPQNLLEWLAAGSYLLIIPASFLLWYFCNVFHIWLDRKTARMADDTGAYADGEYIYINTGEKPPPEKPTLKKEA